METLKKPCPSCPFTKTSMRGYLGGVYDTPNELHSLVMAEMPFTCHVAQGDNDVAWEHCGTEEFPLCAGALAYMKKACKSPRDPELKTMINSIDSNSLDNILSVPEFHTHHNYSFNDFGLRGGYIDEADALGGIENLIKNTR